MKHVLYSNLYTVNLQVFVSFNRITYICIFPWKDKIIRNPSLQYQLNN